jgi:hypothetical protein
MSAGIVRSIDGSLPPAASLPPGALVVSLAGTDRTGLRLGVVLWGVAIVSLGLGIGYYLGKRAR